MSLPADLRPLGQRAAFLCGAALVLRSLVPTTDVAEALPYLALTGTKNAALLTGAAGLFVTFYFLLRVWQSHLAQQLDDSFTRRDADGRPGQSLSKGDAFNLAIQSVLRELIVGIDFWLPLLLAGVMAFVMWGGGGAAFDAYLLTFR